MVKQRKTPQAALQLTFAEGSRFKNYGEALTRIVVNGLRGHRDTEVLFQSPVTAFCGLNGTGKSTLLQLAATAYENVLGTPYYVQSFFVRHPELDKSVFGANTSVRFNYWQREGKTKSHDLTGRLTISFFVVSKGVSTNHRLCFSLAN